MAEDPRTSRRYESHRGSYGYAQSQGPGAGEGEQAQGMAQPGGMRRISWGAIIAATVVALVVYLMLSLLGIGIGAATIEFGAADQAMPEGLGIGAAVWWILTVLIALFIGGWLAGYLSGIPEKRDGAIHGIVTWGLAILLSAWFATTAVGTVAAGAFNVLEGGMAMLGQQQQQPPGEIVEQIDDPELQQQVQEALAQAQQQVEGIADDVTEAVAQAGIWGFVGMLLAAVVAALGGVLGATQTAGRTYLAYPGGERREERGYEERGYPERGREREYERSRYDYDRAERERAERERTEREGALGREGGYEREPGEREREEQRERERERERAEREPEQRPDQP